MEYKYCSLVSGILPHLALTKKDHQLQPSFNFKQISEVAPFSTSAVIFQNLLFYLKESFLILKSYERIFHIFACSISIFSSFNHCFGSGSGLYPDSIRSVDPDQDSESGLGSGEQK
jgi:hypothetical protein